MRCELKLMRHKHKGSSSRMHFCPNDGLIMYLRFNKEHNSILYQCAKCHHEQLCDDNCVSRQHLQNSRDEFARLVVNPYTVHDPTLPTIQKKCMNSSCNATSMVYTRHDQEQMRHLFICKSCLQVWTYIANADEPTPQYLFTLEPVPDEEHEAPP